MLLCVRPCSPRPSHAPWYAAEGPAALAATMPPARRDWQQQQWQPQSYSQPAGQIGASAFGAVNGTIPSSSSSSSSSVDRLSRPLQALSETSVLSPSESLAIGAASSTSSNQEGSTSGDANNNNNSSSSSSSRGMQVVQSPLSSWSAPRPSELRVVQHQLQQLLTSLAYQTSTRLEFQSSFRNFGGAEEL